MFTKSPRREKNPNQDAKRTQLLNFIQKHKSLSPLTTHKSQTSLGLQGKSPNDNTLQQFIKSTSKTELDLNDPKLEVFLSQLKQKLEKVEEASIMIENWKDTLNAKEKELLQRELKAKETEKKILEIKKKCESKLVAVEKKEKELKAKEHEISCSKQEMMREMSMNFEKKAKEIAEQEKKLQIAVNAISREMKKLTEAKEEAVKIECSVLLNELIGCVIYTDYQLRHMEYSMEYTQESIDEAESCEIYLSPNEFGKIEEVSNESSCDNSYEAFSNGFVQNRESILKECDKIGKENQEISDKLEALLMSLNPTGQLD